MRRIFETTLEPSHGFQPNCPWYGKNGMERQKNDSIRRRESSIDRSIHSSLYFYLERNDSLVWEPPFTHYSSPLKRAIDNLDNLNKNAEVSVPQSSPLFPFFSQHHQPHFFFTLNWSKPKIWKIEGREIRKIRGRLYYSIGRMFPWAVSSRSPLIYFGKAGGRLWILSRQGAAWFDIVVYSDPVEVVFVYQRVGGLSSYDRVYLAPVNIFS